MPKKKLQLISPVEFGQILRGLEIVRIAVDSFSGKLLNRELLYEPQEKPVVTVSEKTRYEATGGNDVSMWHAYNLTVSGEESKGKWLSLSVELRLDFECEQPCTDEFFEQYRQMSLRIQTAPFARAWIHDHCLRMEIPPLIMPLVRTN